MIISDFRVRAVRVPMAHPHRTASGAVTESPLVLTDLTTDEGVTGRSIVFTYSAALLKPGADLIANLAALVKGDPVAPLAIHEKLNCRFRLAGTQGLTGMAIAAIDMALWDALAQNFEIPLSQILTDFPQVAFGRGTLKVPERLECPLLSHSGQGCVAGRA